MRGQEFSAKGSPFTIAFRDAAIAKDAYELALKSASVEQLAENGLRIEGLSYRGFVLNSIGLPALRDTLAERLTSGAAVSLDLVLAGLLQFVPADERQSLLRGYVRRSLVENFITNAQCALVERGNPAEGCLRLLSAADEIVAWSHNVKSHQVMVAHLCSPTEGAEVRKSAYAMNEILSDRASTIAFQRIANRGEVLETIGV
jgi:predicted Fe-S protein YdhL (DUF1289 family)